MKKLRNTLYITEQDRYLSLDGENIVVYADKKEIGRVPLHNLEEVVTFGYTGASPALMYACAERDITISFLSPSGRFLARVSGKVRGNVLLRKKQYFISEDVAESICFARNMLRGKLFNARWVLERTKRDHPLQVDCEKLQAASTQIQQYLLDLTDCKDEMEMRGKEGVAASAYFSVFNELILQQKDSFRFEGRTRRPPLDRVNALLSFTYTLLTGMMTSALESVGLDPCVGFFHGDRPGRCSLSLDLMEELRPVFADRFVLTLINKRIVTADDFIIKENGAVLLGDTAKKTVLAEWQKRKQVEILHPFLEEKVQWGMVPFVQAMLLARCIRGDLDEYPPFFWK